jgi:TonB family protein
MRNYWNLALGLSIIIHTVIFMKLPNFEKNFFSKEKNMIKEIEIITQEVKDVTPIKKERILARASIPPYIENISERLNTSSSASSFSLEKPAIYEENLKEIIFSELPQEEDKSLKEIPAYMDYYRLIREKIRRNAFRYYESNDCGEVFLNFVILKNGELENIYLNKEKSVGSKALREIALKSIKNAAPFPSFPEELKDYTRLQFNISIYFKNN